ncbi:hypothetical protein [Crocinitomix algicola]|uniref:hypothetical protein n=1 Tax=Crocinitomix algicola TaxID=1740263 RepID=UPI00083349CA|nr:hypothetical protein [Crocinitomix algicola]
MNRFTLRASLTIIVVYAAIILYRYFTLPQFINGDPQFEFHSAEIVEKDNYQTSIEMDQTKQINLPKQLQTFYLFNLNFPFNRQKINFDYNDSLLTFLRDSSNYVWGEIGTPEFTKALIGYDSLNEAKLLLKIDKDGAYIHSYPYLSLMKWGLFSRTAQQKFENYLVE